MPLPEAYKIQFEESLSRRSYSTSGFKTFQYMFRKLCKDLDEADLHNPAAVLQYRLTMRKGTASLFISMWGIIRQTELGLKILPLTEKPKVMHPHPLYADIMLLGSIFGIDRVTEVTWGEAETHYLFDERAAEARRRAFEWFMGSEATPDPFGPLLVKDAAGRAMSPWQVRYIVNSPTLNKEHKRKDPKADLAQFMCDVIALLVVKNADAQTLRKVCDRLVKLAPYVEQFKFRLAKEDLWSRESLPEILEIIEQFPADEYYETAAMW